jgi:hypothetical protein
MEFYSIRAFKGPEHVVIDVEDYTIGYEDYLQSNYCYNDNYFLLNLKRNRLIDYEFEFRDILIGFYNFFKKESKGKEKDWLLYTMNIVYLFNDYPTDKWIQDELYKVQMGDLDKKTAKEVLSEYLDDNSLFKMFQSAPNQESVFKLIASIHGFKFGTLLTLYKTREDWYPLK